MHCPYFLLEKEVKPKFNSLISYYSNELPKSSAQSGAGTDEVYQSKWPFFHTLEFLRDSIFPRKTNLSFVSSYPLIPIIKYLKYQTTKYSRKHL